MVADGRAAARLEYAGTHTGPLLGLDATGRRFSYAGAAFLTASTDHLTEAWVLGDLAAPSFPEASHDRAVAFVGEAARWDGAYGVEGCRGAAGLRRA